MKLLVLISRSFVATVHHVNNLANNSVNSTTNFHILLTEDELGSIITTVKITYFISHCDAGEFIYFKQLTEKHSLIKTIENY